MSKKRFRNMNIDDVTGTETTLPFGPDEAEQTDSELSIVDQSDPQPDVTKDELEMLSQIFYAPNPQVYPSENGSMVGINNEYFLRLLDDYKPFDLREIKRINNVWHLIKNFPEKGGVVLASGGPHNIYMEHGKQQPSVYTNFRKQGPMYILNPVEALTANNNSWMRNSIESYVIVALNEYVKNAHEFGNKYSGDKSVWFLWEKPGRFIIVDRGEEFWDLKTILKKKKHSMMDQNECTTPSTDSLCQFKNYKYMALMKDDKMVGTMLYLLYGDAQPHKEMESLIIGNTPPRI